MPEKFRDRYRIPSARAVWHAYEGGDYFVTICTQNREHSFDEIVGGEMHLSKLGRCVAENLQRVINHYPYAEIPLFVVMPNHVHLIVCIVPVETLRATSQSEKSHEQQMNETNCQRIENAPKIRDDNHIKTLFTNETLHATSLQCAKNELMAKISPKSGQLSTVIRGIKSAVTKFANQNHLDFAWQTRFHERIIRDQNEMNTVADYIETNVARWSTDELY